MAKHDVLLLGLGFWGTRWVQALHNSSHCRLAGVAGSEADVARLAREYDFSGIKTFTDYRDAVEHTKAEVAVIALPNSLHVDAAKCTLQHGMNVLSEKPLATSIQDAREIVAYTRKYPSLKYMVSQNYRWRPHNQTLRKAVVEGVVGRVGTIHCEFRRPEDLIGYREFLDRPLLQDVSIHHFDLMRFFTAANCARMYAHSFHPAWSKFPGESAVDAVVVMERDITINYNATWAARGKPSSWDGDITVTGERGSLVLNSANQVRFFAGDDTQGMLLNNVEMERTELDYGLDLFIQCLEEDKVPETTLEDNFHSFAMVCAAEESARSAAPVQLT